MNMLLQIDSLLLPLNKNSSEVLRKQALSDRIKTGVEYRLSILNEDTPNLLGTNPTVGGVIPDHAPVTATFV
jgi:hypothetical protein